MITRALSSFPGQKKRVMTRLGSGLNLTAFLLIVTDIKNLFHDLGYPNYLTFKFNGQKTIICLFYSSLPIFQSYVQFKSCRYSRLYWQSYLAYSRTSVYTNCLLLQSSPYRPI